LFFSFHNRRSSLGVTIGKLVTRCRASRRHQDLGGLADRVARRRLATELTHLVGPALARQAPVVRIRRLTVKLELGAAELSEDGLAAAWARAVGRSLFEALAQPGGSSSVQIVRAASAAEFRAAFLRELLMGQPSGRWEYAEFVELFRLPASEAAMTLLLEFPWEITATLIAMDGSPAVERLLSLFDDQALERLFVAIAGSRRAVSTAALSLHDLVWAARQALDTPRRRELMLGGRRQALWVFVHTRGGDGQSPRTIYHALLALVCLLESPELLMPGVSHTLCSQEEIERATGRRLPPAVATFLLDLRRLVSKSGLPSTARSGSPLASLLKSLDDLRPLVPTAAPSSSQPQLPWLETDSLGLLLLASIVHRLDWDALRDDALLAPWGGPRFFQILLIGIGAAVLDREATDIDRLDPAILLFAGMEREPDMQALRYSLASVDVTGRRELLRRLMPDRDGEPIAIDWPQAFDALAERLVGEFASLVRGFRHATRQAVVRQFLRTPGRVQVSRRSVLVLLDANPYHVVLHVSGMDDPTPSLNWMDGRRLEFRLLGL
jgi:hypothetical protein